MFVNKISPDFLATEKELNASGVVFAKHATNSAVDNIFKTVKDVFSDSNSNYLKMDVDLYREFIAYAQEKINAQQQHRCIVDEIYNQIVQFLREERFLIQTNLYLRAARPLFSVTEAIDWHRETFYGTNMEKCVNIWTPIAGVKESNTLRFIPESQLLSDEDILVEQYQDKVTKRYSVGHVIGFQYSPKKIIGGVDLANQRAMLVPKYCSSIFPVNLVHGAGLNGADEIRFSVDFRILPLSAYDSTKKKHFHFASGKPYFQEY
jgi:hypothetical protein